jgi:ABC-type polar amino acid transport system ATPase subunit
VLLGRLVGEGLAVVVVTHDLPFAETLARRRFLMEGGRLTGA